MLIEERLSAINKIINEQKSATIEYLATELKVSKDTIRRDLIKLEEKSLIKRTHGGAIAINREATIMNYQERSNQFGSTKEKIAKKAANLIKDHASVLLDSSTTVEATLAQLSDHHIVAITNSLTHAKLLASFAYTDITLLPGKLHKEQLFLYGTETVKKIEQYQTDYTLLGVFAISEKGLFIHTEEEGLVKRQMIAQGNTVIAVTDHTKLNTTGFFKICDLSEIDMLITDELTDPDLRNALEQQGVEIIVIKGE